MKIQKDNQLTSTQNQTSQKIFKLKKLYIIKLFIDTNMH